MGPEHRPYLKATGYAEEPSWLADELAAAADPLLSSSEPRRNIGPVDYVA